MTANLTNVAFNSHYRTIVRSRLMHDTIYCLVHVCSWDPPPPKQNILYETLPVSINLSIYLGILFSLSSILHSSGLKTDIRRESNCHYTENANTDINQHKLLSWLHKCSEHVTNLSWLNKCSEHVTNTQCTRQFLCWKMYEFLIELMNGPGVRYVIITSSTEVIVIMWHLVYK